MDGGESISDTIIAEIEFPQFHVVVKNNNGIYASGLGRQNIRLQVTDYEGATFLMDAVLPGGEHAMQNFLHRLTEEFATTGQKEISQVLQTLQTAPELQARIDAIVGATWKSWKHEKDRSRVSSRVA